MTINRLDERGGTNVLTVDLAAVFASGDCSKDVPLKWGDIVEIPEMDHKVNEKWFELSKEAKTTLENCLLRKVEIIVNGFTNTVILSLGLLSADSVAQSAQAKWGELPHAIVRSHFWLQQVVNESDVVRTSSDLTRVKVRRTDSATNQPEEATFDLEQVNSNNGADNGHVQVGRGATFDPEPHIPSNDLWLRNGDVIEIPEKP